MGEWDRHATLHARDAAAVPAADDQVDDEDEEA
jgi:hypothetical protein